MRARGAFITVIWRGEPAGRARYWRLRAPLIPLSLSSSTPAAAQQREREKMIPRTQAALDNKQRPSRSVIYEGLLAHWLVKAVYLVQKFSPHHAEKNSI
ncbi:hypothetical protein CDAR_496841 [Caerostris darwini]|uniref:Uncharacterized protein n=1 Tax=Caerostris darwini TaxID=1538125 RepID=A0AAV4U526_9ARAC|nr:hypothetical protein CDAR_496841 [Caerostris darwini]